MIQSAPITFVRHGTTDWSFDSLALGILDLPLNEKGISEIAVTAQKLKGLQNAIIISSPKKRTLQTAEIINRVIDGKVLVETDLDARYYGDFSQDKGSCEKFQAAFKDPGIDEDQLELLLPKDAENIGSFDGRVLEIFNKIIQDFPKKSVILVSHGEVYRSLCRSLVSNKKLYVAKGEMRLFYPPTSSLDNWEVKEKIAFAIQG